MMVLGTPALAGCSLLGTRVARLSLSWCVNVTSCLPCPPPLPGILGAWGPHSWAPSCGVDVPTGGTLGVGPVYLSVVCQAGRVLEQLTTLLTQILTSTSAVGL